MHHIRIKTSALVPFDGTTLDQTNDYAVELGENHKGERVVYCRDIWNGKVSYGSALLIGSLRDLRQHCQEMTDQRAVSVSKSRADDARRTLNKAAAGPVLDAIMEAFTTEADWFAKVWEEVAAEAGAALVDYVGPLPITPVALRKRLRPLMTDAKASVREDYAEDYREAEEKEDFYEQYADDIATAVVDLLG